MLSTFFRSVTHATVSTCNGCKAKSAATIARTLACSEVSPKGPVSGLRMLMFFINRAGKSLTAERRTELEKAKVLLSKRVQRASKWRRRKAAG